MVRSETSGQRATYLQDEAGHLGIGRNEESNMVRNVAGFAVFAVVATVLFKLLVGVLGAVFSIMLSVLFWALIGFAIYTVLKIFAPNTAEKIRSTIKTD